MQASASDQASTSLNICELLIGKMYRRFPPPHCYACFLRIEQKRVISCRREPSLSMLKRPRMSSTKVAPLWSAPVILMRLHDCRLLADSTRIAGWHPDEISSRTEEDPPNASCRPIAVIGLPGSQCPFSTASLPFHSLRATCRLSIDRPVAVSALIYNAVRARATQRCQSSA